MIRRHTKGDGEIHFEPAMRVVSGNYVTAKRRGVVDGVDFGYTGEVSIHTLAAEHSLVQKPNVRNDGPVNHSSITDMSACMSS